MNLNELEAELALYVQDNSLSIHFKPWINNAVLEIANDFDLPALRLKEPSLLPVTESNWLYDMPDTYLKKLSKCYDSDWNRVTISHGLADIDNLDIEHADTGDHVTHVSVRDTQIGIYPKAAESIKLWFYEKPTALSLGTDVLTCIPAQYHSRVVIPKVLVKSYHMLIDMAIKPPHQTLAWWNNKYRGGLYGDGADIGMINSFARDKGVRRTGGRDPLP